MDKSFPEEERVTAFNAMAITWNFVESVVNKGSIRYSDTRRF